MKRVLAVTIWLFVTCYVLATAMGEVSRNPVQDKERHMKDKTSQDQTKGEQQPEYTNHLIKESSPYLLMHAHNPVDWYPWGPEALEKARKENKLLIISIGYAACHWCHVMEQESFAQEEVAEVMNRYFVAVKIDREERPDLDQVYMEAAQLLTGSGGWPLNALALPDGRPVFAGTYFPKERWLALLQQIQQIYATEPQKVLAQAEALARGLNQAGLLPPAPPPSGLDPQLPDRIVQPWQSHFDPVWGGEKRAPKFPMPTGYFYLLHYYYLTRHTPHLDTNQGNLALSAVTTTLNKMAMGGIYDQIGGGFARYSTDEYWKVPHFEKMLYDNAQLVSLYSQAHTLTQNPLYQQVVFQTLEFIERELSGPQGFYSSLDADSEGEEGRFYIWTQKELAALAGPHAPLLLDYFNCTAPGNWEEGKNILFRIKSDEEFARAHNISVEELQAVLAAVKPKLFQARATRIRPALDDKILTAWNALMLKGYVDAYRAFNRPEFLQTARNSAGFFLKHLMAPDGRLLRNYPRGRTSINGFLDDYAFTIEAFIALYQATFEEEWLDRAELLMQYTLAHFYESSTGMFFYTSDLDAPLITRKREIQDNVIPSSNSQMAINLFFLGRYLDRAEYTDKARVMLQQVLDELVGQGPYYANWGRLLLYFTRPPVEVALVGEQCLELRQELDQHFLPQILLSGGKKPGKLPLLQQKLVPGATFIYVCRNKTCLLPVKTVAEALKQIE